MSITMQGGWTVSVKSKSAAFGQRFVVSQPGSPDIIIPGKAGNSVFVNAPQWSINIQSQSGAGQPWLDSRQRIGVPSVSGSTLSFNIKSDDSAGDGDFNDLILTCSMLFSATDYVLFGNAETYSGPCLWNPCLPWIVIETASALQQALLNPALRPIIQRLYPNRVPKRPGPVPDPGPLFRPLVIPTGTLAQNNGLVFHSAAAQAAAPQLEIKTAADVKKYHEAAAAQLRASASPVVLDSSAPGSSSLSSTETLAIATLREGIERFWNCRTSAAPGLLLNFQEYTQTSAEQAGGPYTGTGAREDLGLAVTDELGNYIFRFTYAAWRHYFPVVVEEQLGGLSGEIPFPLIHPNVIVQALGASMDVEYETTPYYNIPNLLRINLCIPLGSITNPGAGCASYDRTIYQIGDIVVLYNALGGSPNTLDGSGRITCRNANAPQVDCAGWRGGLRLYACFGASGVANYTVRYSFDNGSTFSFVNEGFDLNYIPAFAPGYTGTPVGPTYLPVQVDGNPAQVAPTYANHEGDSNWLDNTLKLILSSGYYQPPTGPGPVLFKIEGYNAAGHHVPSSVDSITLYIDNVATSGSIESVNLGSPAGLDECALLTLPSANSPLTVQYSVDNAQGMLADWELSVTRGNNYALPVTVVGGVTPQSYPAAGLADPCNFHGSPDYPLDASLFTETTLQPAPHVDPGTTTSNSNWLPAGYSFCAFAFTLSAHDRVTDGRNGYPETVFWQDLVGINAPSS
jgi:hypothetical protein